MKELIIKLYGTELERFRSLPKRKKAAAVYAAASLFILVIASAGDSAALVLASVANMAVAMRIGGQLFKDREEQP